MLDCPCMSTAPAPITFSWWWRELEQLLDLGQYRDGQDGSMIVYSVRCLKAPRTHNTNGVLSSSSSQNKAIIIINVIVTSR